jgi:hypothetical protein
VRGLLADANITGHVEYLARLMQTGSWGEFWQDLGLVLRHFADVGLSPSSTDLEIWQRCQAQQPLLVTDNRNAESPDSLEAVIRLHNTPQALPVFTIADVDKLRTSQAYAECVMIRLYEYLLDIENLRGAGRLFVP